MNPVARRRLPIGIQTFGKLREQDCYYVDKTAFIERLLRGGTHYFLSRPRAVRQEPVSGHAEGAVRGQRGAVRRALHPRPPRLVTAASGGTAELRQRQLHRARDAARGRGIPVGGPGGGGGHCISRRQRCTALAPSAANAASADGTAGGGTGGRVRQADPGRIGGAGGGAREPRLPARAVRGDQGLRRARAVHVPHRHQQVLEGEPVLAVEQSHRPYVGSALLVNLRLYGRGSGHGVRGGTGRAGPGTDPRVVQRLPLARRREGVQPVRRAVAVRQPRVRRALVRDGDAGVSGGPAVQTPSGVGVAGPDGGNDGTAVEVRRGPDRHAGVAVPDRLPDSNGGRGSWAARRCIGWATRTGRYARA